MAQQGRQHGPLYEDVRSPQTLPNCLKGQKLATLGSNTSFEWQLSSLLKPACSLQESKNANT